MGWPIVSSYGTTYSMDRPYPSASSRLVICIPARNEARELPGLFAALEGLKPATIAPANVCLMLDGCTDESVALTAAYRSRSRHLVHLHESADGHPSAGRARRRAMELGLEIAARPEDILLTTDADSRPLPDWLVTMTAGLAKADVVAGKIVRSNDRPNLLQDRLEHYYDGLFALRRHLDPVPWEAAATHHHVGGANLGVGVQAYRALGGFLPLEHGEDARLVDDAARAGLRVRRDAVCVVRTSDRRHGRAQQGLAQTLRQLDGADALSIRVAHPADVAWQYRMQAAARRAFLSGRPEQVAADIGLTEDHVIGVARDCPNAEAFAMRVVPAAPGGMREIGLPQAEAALDLLVAQRQAAA
ncbi:glycosyltransferase family 2 protein [Sphingomonas bacterium]|uniref:glycosyltransferase n=1 Tax=Sphingomonas bacterium TaxID=1895847 RepID=UPI0015759F28|nr:glycosyltransferase [Sphingomonas bacterium]